MTIDKCCAYIDHVFKVIPTCVIMKGNATGDVPKKLFTDRSKGKSIAFFQDKLTSDLEVNSKYVALMQQWI